MKSILMTSQKVLDQQIILFYLESRSSVTYIENKQNEKYLCFNTGEKSLKIHFHMPPNLSHPFYTTFIYLTFLIFYLNLDLPLCIQNSDLRILHGLFTLLGAQNVNLSSIWKYTHRQMHAAYMHPLLALYLPKPQGCVEMTEYLYD